MRAAGSVWLLAACALFGSPSAAAGDVREPAEVVAAFHAALAAGDAAAAEALLAPDAIVLESGHVETRGEYVSGHLAADIAFARAVRSERSDVRVAQQGDVAWVSASSRAQGSFRGRAVRSQGAELVVLARGAEGWRIRAIHWSSHERKSP
jgi:ketosteroid isomerase-like protein